MLQSKSNPNNAQTSSNYTYAGSEKLWSGEKYLLKYNHDLILKLTQGQKGVKNVLEFGAGIGTLALLWEKKTNFKPECLEIDPEQRQIILERGFRCHKNLSDIENKFDVIYTSNVLEHIEDDQDILNQLNSKLVDGGSLIIYVPAFQVLYSNLDRMVGHYRRYEKSDLIRKLKKAGFATNKSQYSDSIGFLAWLYIKLKGAPEGQSESQSMKIYDRYIFPLSKIMDAIGFKYFFGKNLLLYATKFTSPIETPNSDGP